MILYDGAARRSRNKSAGMSTGVFSSVLVGARQRGCLHDAQKEVVLRYAAVESFWNEAALFCPIGTEDHVVQLR